MPLFWGLAHDGSFGTDPYNRAVIVAIVTGITAFLMVSSLPVWGFKAIHIPRSARLFVLAAIGLFAAALAQTPWMMLFVISAAYTVALPFAILRYASLRKAERSADGAA